MSASTKSSNAQFLRMMLYRRALHPELFDLQGRRVDRHGDYEVESWLINGEGGAGHLVRFQVAEDALIEVCMDRADHLPETGLMHALPCVGEKDFELEAPEGPLRYVTTIQTEALTDNLYTVTYREMQDFARETGSLAYEGVTVDGSRTLSVLDTQKYKHEFHIQSYHLLGGSGTVLRTQSIFEIAR